MPDDVHLLASFTANVHIPNVMRQLKSMTTKWIRAEIHSCQSFAWQEGYGIFSSGRSNMEAVVKYIQNQEQHHKNVTFDEEYIGFLKMHNLPFDPRFVLG